MQPFRSGDMDIYLYCTKGQECDATCTLRQAQEQLHYAANTTSALCKHLHRQQANTKLAKEEECILTSAKPSSSAELHCQLP